MIFLCAVSISAQTTEFTYQGKLTDGGMPPTANYDMQFRLFDNPDAGQGTQNGATLTKPGVPANNGLFTVRLDFGAAVFAAAADLYLEISLRPAGSSGGYTSLAPRQKLTSSPFSIRALSAVNADNAASVSGLTAGDFIQNTTTQQTGNFNISGSGIVGGNIGIGTPTPRAKLDVAGNAVQDLSANGFVKAMVFVTVTQNQQGQISANVVRCFNGVTNSSS